MNMYFLKLIELIFSFAQKCNAVNALAPYHVVRVLYKGGFLNKSQIDVRGTFQKSSHTTAICRNMRLLNMRLKGNINEGSLNTIPSLAISFDSPFQNREILR